MPFAWPAGDLMSPVTTYLCLAGAILTEAIATIALAASQQSYQAGPEHHIGRLFRRRVLASLLPAAHHADGIVYAIWSGLGIVLITAVAWVWAKQALDVPALIGMALITAGVIVINVFSKSEGSAMTGEASPPEQTCTAAKSPSTKCE